jgi:hypothetical protein
VTDEQLSLLKSSVDQIVAIEMNDGDRHLGQILFVFDEGDTPDVFYLKIVPGPEGELVPQEGAGCSVLLSDIAAVYPRTAV